MLMQSSAEVAFISYIKSKLNDPSFARDYLKLGLSSDLNPGNFLTPEIFKEYFLVERNEAEEVEIASLIKELFRSDTKNLFVLEADRGSGKSTFINTMPLFQDKRYLFEYPYPCFDLTRRGPYNSYCENEVSLKLSSLLTEIRSNAVWHSAFFTFLNRVSIYGTTFRDVYYRAELKSAIDACKTEAGFDSYLLNHDKRTEDSRIRDCDIKVFLLLYLVALATRPNRENDKERRWIIIFDGIEALVTRDAERIIEFINDIHLFIESAFDSVDRKTTFYTRFTFVIPVRTATSLNIQDYVVAQSRNIWGNRRDYIKRLPKFSFSLMALLKKLMYLVQINGGYSSAKSYPLVEASISVVAALLPRPTINRFLSKQISSDEALAKLRYFAEQRLLPLLNYDHRNAVDKLCDLASLGNSNVHLAALMSIEQNIANNLCQINYAVNGKNMILLRNIFDEFHSSRENLFEEIGYSDFNEQHQPGVARTMLNFLYYRELKYRLDNINQPNVGDEYSGVTFSDLLDLLRPFAEGNIGQLSSIIYKISALNATSVFSTFWTNLIVIQGLEERLDESGFNDIITDYYQNVKRSSQSRVRFWRVRLSDAGICFTTWASKQFEFLLSRCNQDLMTNALFAYDIAHNPEGIMDACKKVRSIIESEAIEKLIDGCLTGCKYCTNQDTKNCKFEKNLFECSLFQRYQECLFLIVDSIDYIDRFRIYLYEVNHNSHIPSEEIKEQNCMLLDIISSFCDLFCKLRDKVTLKFSKPQVFFEKMNALSLKCKALGGKDSSQRISAKGASYLKKLRLPRTSIWYMNSENEMQLALSAAKETPSAVELFNALDDEKTLI